MFTLEDIAAAFGLKINTLRYWIKKNNTDFERNYYDFNLADLIQKIKIYKKVKGKIKGRKYEQYIVLDIDEFRTEYTKYLNYIEQIKNKKRTGNLSWSNSAIDCYSCNMICDECFNKEICSAVISNNPQDEPPMKHIVKKLLSEIGKPPL